MKNFKITALCLSLVFLVGIFTGCKTKKAQSYESFDYFNTFVTVKVDKATDESFAEFTNELEKIFNEISDASSLTNGDAKKINDAPILAETEISKTAYELIVKSKECYYLTDYKFNPAIYPLVKLWSFTPDTYVGVDGSYTLPDSGKIEELKQKLDYTSLAVFERDGKFYAVKHSDIKIDLGGIAKGYALDKAYKLYENYEFKEGYISLGSSSVGVFGNKKLSVRNPLSQELSDTFIKIDCADKTFLSTSGDYERYYYIDGVKYSHIIDPVTGYPADYGIVSATVMGDAIKADALTTALLTMSVDNAKSFIEEKLSDYKVFLVVKSTDGVKILTNTDNGFTVTNENFTLIKI